MPTGIKSVCCHELSKVAGSFPDGEDCITQGETFKSMVVHKVHVRIHNAMHHLEPLPTIEAMQWV